MHTIWREEDRCAIIDRASRVRPDASPLWGSMTAPRMMAHLTDALKMTLGELPVPRRPGPLRFPPLRHAIIHWLPFPKGAPTAQELLARSVTDWESELTVMRGLLERIAARKIDGEWPEHAAFGCLSGRDWGVLIYRHMDHHLRQFGA